ncbi:hypothetical protein [Streptomyces sp. NRRL S-1824]|uniref:hypothetical protein n=1 Tax=Streptomyces sp. NRRL S-1824 TaxID=1463889 RepID=UPI000AF9DB98|nr:hypothetical protein [Streptomyces sp. NRRL S-1824]
MQDEQDALEHQPVRTLLTPVSEIRGARLVILPRTRHGITFEACEQAARLAREFVRLPPGRPLISPPRRRHSPRGWAGGRIGCTYALTGIFLKGNI